LRRPYRPASLRWEQSALLDVRQEHFRLRSTQLPRHHCERWEADSPGRLGENIPELLTRSKPVSPTLAALRASFLGGQWLYFGPVAIHRESIRFQKRRIRMNQVPGRGRQITVRSGALIIEPENQRTFVCHSKSLIWSFCSKSFNKELPFNHPLAILISMPTLQHFSDYLTPFPPAAD
jgi:hypothetical protein